MNLKHMTEERIKDDLFLPDEALVALFHGEEWEFQPDSCDGGEADVHWCDDCETWHQTWSVWGLRLNRDGVLYETEHYVDSDGDWSSVDEYPYGTYDHDLDNASRRERWKSYARWVIDHNGDDPLGNYLSDSGPERVAIALRNLKES
jgi:hypothetical protein